MKKEDTQGVSSSFTALMAARDAQDRTWTEKPLATPALQKMVQESQAIALIKKPVIDKQKIMDLILQGDMEE